MLGAKLDLNFAVKVSVGGMAWSPESSFFASYPRDHLLCVTLRISTCLNVS